MRPANNTFQDTSEQLILPGSPHEFAMRDAEFERICRLIYQRAGITLAPSKRTMVYSRLARRLRALGDASFAEYLKRLDDLDAQEWEQFVNALTTNLTSFYREPHHFEILREHLKARRTQGRLRIWCSAASSGEEPYTLAFTAIEAFGSLNPPIEIIATDIDTTVLQRARLGVYPLDAVKSLPAERVARFFRRGVGENAGMVKVLTLLERMAPRLDPDGLLFAGHSENLSHARAFLHPLGQTVYRLAAAGPKAPLRTS
jgi:chemotaxis protein methyltransferase CheR